MSDAQQRALARRRRRREQAGVVGLERQVRRDGVGLVRGAPVDLKALLAAAPLEGLDLECEREIGRPVEL